MERIVNENIIPYNDAYCTYILNAAPNREGLIDPNAVAAFRRIGQLWQNTGHLVDVPEAPAPIIDLNLAADRPCDSSWSDDMMLMDFANDDNFSSCWVSSPAVREPWWRVDLDPGTPIATVAVTEGPDCKVDGFTVEVLYGEFWIPVFSEAAPAAVDAPAAAGKVHICRFTPIAADAVRLRFTSFTGTLSIAEVGVYAH